MRQWLVLACLTSSATGFAQESTVKPLAEGWDYTDSSLQAFQLYGAACAAARANRGELPTVQYVCPAV